LSGDTSTEPKPPELEGAELKRQKEALRARFRAARRALPLSAHAERSRELSRLIFEALSSDERLGGVETIACYDAFDGEPDLSALYQALRSRSTPTRLAFPIHSRGEPLKFYEAQTWEERPGSYRRPVGPSVALDELELLLTPGVAFTPSGLRLGFGGGFYDRSFPALSGAARSAELEPALKTSGLISFGVAFSLQLTPSLPSAPWDIQVDAVVSERGWCGPHPGSSQRRTP